MLDQKSSDQAWSRLGWFAISLTLPSHWKIDQTRPCPQCSKRRLKSLSDHTPALISGSQKFNRIKYTSFHPALPPVALCFFKSYMQERVVVWNQNSLLFISIALPRDGHEPRFCTQAPLPPQPMTHSAVGGHSSLLLFGCSTSSQLQRGFACPASSSEWASAKEEGQESPCSCRDW